MRVSQQLIDEFLALRTLAVVGASRRKNNYGNIAYRELTQKGYQVYIVHPSGDLVEGVQSYTSLDHLPEQVEGVVVVISADLGIKLVQDAHDLGIHHIWLQPGAESAEIIEWGDQHGMSIIHHACIMTQLNSL